MPKETVRDIRSTLVWHAVLTIVSTIATVFELTTIVLNVLTGQRVSSASRWILLMHTCLVIYGAVTWVYWNIRHREVVANLARRASLSRDSQLQ